MSKVVKFITSPIGAIIGGKAGKLISAAAMIAIGVATGNPALIMAGLSTGASALRKTPKPPSVAHDRLFASLDPSTPRKIIYGRTAMATDVRYQAFTGTDQEYYHQIMCVASHEVEAIEEIWFDNELAWTLAGGAQGRYAGYLTVVPRLVGTASNGIAIDSVWTAACTLTGCAYLHLKFKLSGNDKKAESPFAQQIPSRVTVRGKGAKVYDARFDSTAGGSGTQRVNDQSTWAFAPSGVESGRNQALQLLHYLMGWKINGKLAIGRGMPSARFDVASFITAANLNDEAVAKAAGGTEPRYRSDGAFSEGDDPSTVIDNLLASMNAVLRDDGGRISLHVLHNDLGSPVAHFDENDILGDERWQQTPSIDQSFNLVRGRYTDASNEALYQMVDAPEVSIASVDGIDRIDSFDVAVCQSPSQWQRLAKQRAQRNLYPGVYSANFGARAWQVSLGKVVTFSHVGLGWDHKLFRVISHGVAVNGVVPMALIEENAAIYAWDKEEQPAVQAAVPTVYDPTKGPVIQALADLDGTVTDLDAALDAATAAIAAISSDAVLSAAEKPGLVITYNQAIAQWASLDAKAAELAPTFNTQRTAASTAKTALVSYLAGLAPAWNDASANTTIVAATFQSKWSDFYTAIFALDAAITGRQGPAGADGANAIVAFLTNETVSVPATSAGVVTDTTGAGGRMRVFLGTTEVTAACTFTAVAFGSGGYGPSNFNPNTDWVINADGSYALMASPVWTGDVGWFLVRATHTASGTVIDKVFTVTKALGGAAGANAKTLIVLADRQTIAYDGAGAATPAVQTTTFSTNKQNTSATVIWSITDAAGVARTPATTYLSAATGDSVTMTEAQFAAARNGTAGVIVTGSLSDGGTITDKISVVRVQGGAAGISPIAVSVDPPSLTIACSYDGTPKSGELPASFAFTAIKGAAGVAIDTLAITGSGGCTVAVSGSAVNLTAISAASGGFVANVTAGGQTVPVAVNFTTTNDAPPASTTVTDSSTTNVSSGTYAVIGGELTAKASATGKLRVKLSGSYKTQTSIVATTALTGKLQIKPTAGSYADVTGSETTGSTSSTTDLGDGGPYKTFSGGLNTGWVNLTGLVANADYVLRRQAKLTTGSAATSYCFLVIAAEPVA